jgi:hypothetical protein
MRLVAFRGTARMTAPTRFVDPPPMSPSLPPAPIAAPAAESPLRGAAAEREIARLTWAVLDGSASLADRQRLGELVNAQHAARRRPL